MIAHLEGLSFYGDDSPNVTYTLDHESLAGLFGGAEVRDNSVPLPTGHGNVRVRNYRDGRVLPLRGLILTRSVFEQQHAMDALAQVLADGRESMLSIETAADTRAGMVTLADKVQVAVEVPGTVARYLLLVKLDDPRMVGNVNEFSGSSVQVHHYGTFPADPVVEVVGPRSAPYTVSGPSGKSVVVSQSLTSGQTHRIDFGEGSIRRNGAIQARAATTFRPWTIPPGSRVSMSISSGSMKVEVPNTYI